jgi:hypothetical protein
MAPWSLPDLSTVAPLPTIDPKNVAPAYVDLLGMIYHAEFAAMDTFDRLIDPEIVIRHDALLRARPILVADEKSHLLDLEDLIRSLGADAVPPQPEEFDTLWDFETARRRLLYPLPPYVAAMFILVTESMGFAVLSHLARHTADPMIASRLASNVQDETAHVRVGMHALLATIGDQDRPLCVLSDLALHIGAFGLISRPAARRLGRALGGVGWRPEVVLASAAGFTSALIEQVLSRYFDRPAGQTLPPLVRSALLSPVIVRALMASAVLPEPPLLWPLMRLATRVVRPRQFRLQ